MKLCFSIACLASMGGLIFVALVAVSPHVTFPGVVHAQDGEAWAVNLSSSANYSAPNLAPVVSAAPTETSEEVQTVDICDRTQQIRDAILAAPAVTVTDCALVPASELTEIPNLRLVEQGITSLKAGDFDGLTGITKLEMDDNSISSVAPGVFDQLTNLTKLDLCTNRLTRLPPGIFDQLTLLTELNLYDNQLLGLPKGAFDSLAKLKTLNLYNNRGFLTTLPPGVFDSLTNLETLDLRNNPNLSYSPYLLSPLSSLEKFNDSLYTRPEAPGAPTGLTGTFTSGNIELSWTAPATGVAPTSYQILRKAGDAGQMVYVEDTYDPDTVAVTYTDTNITEGQRYYYRVRALNAGGAGPESNAAYVLASLEPITAVPGAPTLTGVTHGDASLTVNWTAPPHRPGVVINSYKVRWTTIGGSFNAGDTALASARQHTIQELANGTAYQVQVIAVGIGGDSDPSNTMSRTPSTTPGKPSVTLQVGEVAGAAPGDRIRVSWTAPSETGGFDITEYRVQWKSGSQDFNKTNRQAVVTSGLTYTITGLNSATEYDVQVTASNGNGGGPASDVRSSKPSTVPDAPTGLTLTAGDGSLAAAWTAPASGGSPITGYRVELRTESQAWADATLHSSSTANATITASRGFAYVARVIAINANGDSNPSGEASASVLDAPGPPTGVTLTRGDKELSVEWTAPAPDDLRPMEQYVVRWRADGEVYDSSREARVTTLSQVIRGLTNGVKYFVQVSAENSIDESDPSAEVSETPGATPGQPTNVNVTPGDGELIVEWRAPSEIGGFDITEYRVQWKSGSQDFNKTNRQAVITSGLTYTITGLNFATLYTVRVLVGHQYWIEG